VKHYLKGLEGVKEGTPEALTTLHLAPEEELPGEILNSKYLDFYMYQSGHHLENQERAYKSAAYFCSLPVKRPIVNGEPCYDGCGHGHRYGRFGAFDVRKAIWQSLLSGAKAGVAYGAHGVWSWHRRGMRFTSEGFSGLPLEWQEALRLEGAWDAGYAKWVFESFGLYGLRPVEGVVSVVNPTAEIRVAVDEAGEKVAVYMPYAVELKLGLDLRGYRLVRLDLGSRRVLAPEVEYGQGESTVGMAPVNGDSLLIGVKQ
jgi:hypothetical protein